MTRYRQAVLVQPAQATADGAGVKIHRSIGFEQLHRFDPFLLLDELGSDDAADYIGGFPDHPHRGFQTFTYLLAGEMAHSDHLGHSGRLLPGGVQWMKAGSGIIHSEMPQQSEGLLHGFQLWINLPKVEKMSAPEYQDFSADAFPVITFGEHETNFLRVLAGKVALDAQLLQSPVMEKLDDVLIAELAIAEKETINLPINTQHTAIVYVFEGELQIEGETSSSLIKSQNLALLSEGDRLKLTAKSASKALILSGLAFKEPIAHWGPFVMNTREEVEQAMRDYQRGKLTERTLA